MAVIQTLSVYIADSDVTLGPRTNESYTLSVCTDPSNNGKGIEIHAETVYGAMHGFVSLWQLSDIVYDSGGNTILSASVPNLPIFVKDAPRFGYRGLLVDTGRHFLPVSFLKTVIDGLEMNKLNVLHWHLVDAQSFPCGSSTFPELAEKGAYSYPAAAYSTDDLKALVAYAKERGVRIMPEWVR
jgi:hexosaminidase